MTISNTPTISVVMCVYNGETFVARAIESILAQTFSDFEFIIVDDGSTDTTSDILQRYADSDERIILLTNKSNIGLTKSLNKALAHVHGEFVARQDADDESYPERFAKQVQAFRDMPDTVLVTSHFDIAGYQGKDMVYRHAQTEIEQRWTMLFYNHISGHSGVMLRTSVVKALGGYDEDFRYAQDYELWSRMIRENPFYIIPEALFKMNFHGGNISETKQAEQLELALKTINMQISWLLSESLSEGEIRDLHFFWIHKGNEVQDYSRLQKNLQRIWQKFCETHQLNSEQGQQIKQGIATRFWQLSDLKIDARLHAIWYAFQWDRKSSGKRVKKILRRQVKKLILGNNR